MKLVFLVLILILPLTLVGSDPSAQAALVTFTKSSTVAQDEEDDEEANGFLITDPAGPFQFQQVDRIREITRITITLTLAGAGTQQGDPDRGDLTLALDGIDTGIKLNGFPQADQDTRTNSGVPINERAIRAALKADGKLAASIIDASPGDNGMSGSSADTTTLVIKGKRRS
jgi:hypothetical protein